MYQFYQSQIWKWQSYAYLFTLGCTNHDDVVKLNVVGGGGGRTAN